MTLPPGAGEARLVGGGDINEAFRVRLADGREAFVKTRREAIAGEYAAEAAGLAWLAEPGLLRTPAVMEVDEAYLALQWIEPGALSSLGAEELGRGLAGTHRAGAEDFGAPPALRGGDTGFGSLRLPNGPATDWPSFYAGQRLLPLLAIARERGAISASAGRAVESVCERIGELCGPSEPPARLHGDLWSGNVMADGEGRAWLIDPSAYGGHREVDLAMLRLFGGWAGTQSRIFDAYEEAWPLAEGWRDRVELYQLLPMLVHALLFGGSYRAGAERIAMSYAR
ncbi:MAG TPA: fructosamine kinase family protein [Solirubrobacteraceae bacterium]|jgi:fructosamine-3-kinase|nr:fructosamine kinase family protein [Solirubrobacteraceae bacterium]